METIIQKALAKGIISFDSEQKYITYTHQNKKRSFQNPEEKVQAETFCKLILQYGYPEKCIQQFVSVKMGVSDKEADIVVYNDEECTKPYIIAECKSEDISELEFQEAVKQAFSYAHALAGTSKYVWVTKGNKEEFYKFDKEKNTKEPISEIPYFGESETKKYRFAKGGFYKDKVQGKETTIKIQDIQPISENELTKLFKQAHDALWAGGELNPSEAFDELDKLIFCKVWDEKNTKKGEPYQFQILNEEVGNLKKRINELYDKGKVKDPEVFNKPIDLTAERIKTIVEYFQKISLSETDLDNKGKAFETFLGTYFRGEFGAYFTPRTIVKFAVEALPIINESRVLDTSCGSGGFLLYVLDKVRRQATEIYTNAENDIREYQDWHRHWHDFAEKNLFGIEINEQISRVAKMNMIIHDDGHTNVIQHDGLYEIEVMAKKNKGFAANSFDFIVTNPPFGSIVKQSEKAYMQTEKNTAPYYDFSLKEINWIDKIAKGSHLTTGRENQSTEVLFIEQIHKFLRAGGYLAVVIPDGILTNSSLGYVREGIEEKFRIVAVVSLPQTAFTNTGAGVKSSVLFLKKYDEKTTQEIKKAKDKIISILDDQKQIKKTIDALEAEKKQAIKTLTAKDEETQLRKKIITDEYNERINNFKEELNELYETEKQRQLPDYPIFMAIAENIGYDATGKNTQKVIEIDENSSYKGKKVIRELQENDLFTAEIFKQKTYENGKEVINTLKENVLTDKGILGELRRFIEAIENGSDSFFV